MELQYRDPDRLLKQLETEESCKGRGKLKIFFGYAAGVGKTYAMLASAHLAQEQGIDVAAGYIEPHSRPETAALLQGLEQLPPRSVQHHHIILQEFDLDHALKRRPQLILVDELAHTNAPGSRHTKRYQDIEELLKAGIDVYTTVNVQHIESLNDIVSGITGVAVQERIPDFIFDQASQVELVDIEPEELIERLKQGKIYKQSQASQAMSHFFTVDNLVALREIALRRMADRVNLLLEKYNAGPAASLASEHILICLSPSPSNEKVIRSAARMAAAFHAKFTALFVETPDFSQMPKEDLDRLRRNIRLAEQLGAKTVASYGGDVVEQIAEYARAAQVSKIVLGKTYTKRSWFSMRESFSDQLSKLAPQLELFMIPDTYDKKYTRWKKRQKSRGMNHWISDILVSCGILLLSTLICFLFFYLGFSDANLVMVYILGVLMTSLLTHHKICSSALSILSVLVFNFCFTAPVQTLNVYDPGYIITFIIMFLTALISSTLTQKVKKHARQAALKSYRTELLLETSQKLQQAADSQEISLIVSNQLSKLLERNIIFYLGSPELDPHPLIVSHPSSCPLQQNNKEELAVAQWVFKNNKHAGFSTSTLPGVRCLYLAVRNGDKVFAVIGIDMEQKALPAFEQGIMSAILNECALALEKEELIAEQKNAAVKLQQEQLRGDLLRSISHDLRTPLTSISGSAGILLSNSRQLQEPQKQKLYTDIYNDAAWLIHLVENLLSVTRLENGAMKLNLQTELLAEVIAEALKHVHRKRSEHQILVRQQEDLLMAKIDTQLMIQVFINLVDNAIKYTPPGSTIQITTFQKQQEIIVEVADNGPGIPEEEKKKLFDMFHTSSKSSTDGQRGLGLGLALCKSIIRAHGGHISVLDNPPHGTIIRFSLKAEPLPDGAALPDISEH